jgi:CubicO group peptidase (beta-lactamase class C family)
MNAAVLDSIDREIAEGRYGHVDRFLVVRAGRAVLDRRYARDWDAIYGDSARRRNGLVLHDQTGAYNYFNPWWHPTWRRGDLHSLQSVTKTITSILIGVAAARGEFPSLDTPVLRFFDTTAVKEIDDRKRRMTIRHLLTMTGGFDWNENLPYIDPRNSTIAMEGSYDWVSFTIDRPMAREPGTAFNYNSGETVLLAHIFRVATGADIEEYAARHLFTPLGITRWFWKRTPAGLVDTEGGLYLEAADLARIWYLFLRNGRWEGRQVVTEQWVRESVTPAVATGPNRNNAWYGYKWWLHRDPTDSTRWVWAGSGFGGQLPYVFPELDLVVVFNGWNILPGGRGIPQRAMLERLARAVVVPAAPQRSPGR